MVFMVMGLLSLIPFNTHVLDPIKLALQDFDYNDMAYSKFNKNSHTGVDTNIVIVNIGNADREGIASLLEKTLDYQPAAIGVDVVFYLHKEALTDSLLSAFFSGNKNTVLAYNLQLEKEKVEPKSFLYPVAANKGFANFVGEERGTIRYFAPVIKKENESYLSFTSALMKIADEKKYEAFAKRNKTTEQINYSRSADKYLIVSGGALLADTMQLLPLKGKIVLVGFVAADPYSIEDKHFTPLNEKSVGKSVPDMPGVLIHANIISMMQSGDYINKWPVWIVWVLAVILCWLHMSLFIRYFVDKHIWFHLVAKIAQLLSAILIVYLGLLFFYKWDIRINLTPSFVAIILAVDVLYFYEAMVAWLHKKFGFQSLFVHHHGH
jgi:CHASE2 domain-containing sensor protein